MKIPCEDCLCVPVCRMKTFFNLLHDCSKLSHILYKDGAFGIDNRKLGFYDTLEELDRKIKPVPWCYSSSSERVLEKLQVCERW